MLIHGAGVGLKSSVDLCMVQAKETVQVQPGIYMRVEWRGTWHTFKNVGQLLRRHCADVKRHFHCIAVAAALGEVVRLKREQKLAGHGGRADWDLNLSAARGGGGVNGSRSPPPD